MQYVVQLSGESLLTATLVLTVMILPIMIALTSGALAAVPPAWHEGSVALGVNRWRTIWRVSVRAARPAIVSATVLGTARALGEAIMLAMLGGGRPFAPNPLDGLTFLFEPIQPLAASIVKEFGDNPNTPIGHTVYAIGAAAAVQRGAALARRVGRAGNRSNGTGSAYERPWPRWICVLGRSRAKHATLPASLPSLPWTSIRRPTMSAPAAQPPVSASCARAANRPPRGRSIDRLAYGLCWAVGIGLCVVAVGIVLFMFVKGISALRLSLFVESPSTGVLAEKHSGGFLDPLVGTFIVTAIGIAIAAPVGVGIAVWLVEYARPRWLARAVESAIETIAGIPSIVLALFGLLIFARPLFAFLSGSASNGTVSGQSFLNAGIMMSVLALPLVVVATREALLQLPARMREASYALGKTRATTIRRVLLPSAARGSPAARCWGWAGSSATRRSS